MATDQARVRIDGDASGLKGAAKEGKAALKGLGSTADAESKKLGLYGERLGKAFGPGEGLHGRLDSLEMPLRDTEGAFARAQSAVIAFGNDGATATDKISAGFLLAGDSIASFVSGGVIGVAIAAAVAGIALLTDAMGEESEASAKAAEETKKHADALMGLARSAAAANITVSLQRAKNREKEVREQARADEDERLAVGRKYNRLIDMLRQFEKDKENASKVAHINAAMAGIERTNALLEIEKKKFDRLDAAHKASLGKISQADKDVANEVEANQENAITKLVALLDKIESKTTATIEKQSKKRAKAVESFEDVMSRAAKSDKERTDAQRALRLEDEAFDKRKEEKQERIDKARSKFAERSNKGMLSAIKERDGALDRSARDAKARDVKQLADFKEKHSVELAATNALIGGLAQMAHDGEMSFEALADAAITAAGKELTAKGTVHLMAGLANMAATFGAHGGPEAAQGAAMVAAGIGMGAVGGSIGRSASSDSAPSSGRSTPTDTRRSAAASSSAGSSEGGATVIHFHGPAYDKRGVSQVITSGQRMARHRRVQGA